MKSLFWSEQNIQSAGSSQDVPGFRKIRPRTECIFFHKSSGREKRPEACVSRNDCAEGGVESHRQELSSLGSEEDQVERYVTVDPVLEATAVSLNTSTALQGADLSTGRLVMIPQSSRGSTILESMDGCAGGAVTTHLKADTHMVTIIPNHVRTPVCNVSCFLSSFIFFLSSPSPLPFFLFLSVSLHFFFHFFFLFFCSPSSSFLFLSFFFFTFSFLLSFLIFHFVPSLVRSFVCSFFPFFFLHIRLSFLSFVCSFYSSFFLLFLPFLAFLSYRG